MDRTEPVQSLLEAQRCLHHYSLGIRPACCQSIQQVLSQQRIFHYSLNQPMQQKYGSRMIIYSTTRNDLPKYMYIIHMYKKNAEIHSTRYTLGPSDNNFIPE